MYLKSIEVQGFKSFANKIVFQFHNGITGIVGPNGSGKSNVADAVRWVLGEQRIKQLRGASMQDVIFSGTETRKPLSYAYVAITLDNTDHQLSVDYDEVTVARRIYRSGESEYLINGSICRLKDVNELFYDTGIGKEGYSIIGQGQIDKILSGKPEERRELFDEAAGIVKFKRRKAAAVAKLENEKQNLVRVNDILSELERQVGPLEKQSEVAKTFLKMKEELKTLDINVFLLENQKIRDELIKVEEKYNITNDELTMSKEKHTAFKEEFDKIQDELETLEKNIEETRDSLNDSDKKRGQLQGEINVIKERINSFENSEKHWTQRKESLEEQISQKNEAKNTALQSKEDMDKQVSEIQGAAFEANEKLNEIQSKIEELNDQIEVSKTTIMDELNKRASISSKIGSYETRMEQNNIRRAELNSKILRAKTDEEAREQNLKKLSDEFEKITEEIGKMNQDLADVDMKLGDIRESLRNKDEELRETQSKYHQEKSKLEALSNLTERYEGYGGSVKKVMEQKEKNPGIIGVVADIIKVDKKYETAIETALGGNIQNIVTDDEDTAKKMISFLKVNKLGRATFLPLTSITHPQEFKNPEALDEKGVIGMADELVNIDEKYKNVAKAMLGRIVVVDTVDNAFKIARKFDYGIRMVTLEGELLVPGGAISGGTFKNNSNLLGRRRELDELEKVIKELSAKVDEINADIEKTKSERNKLRMDAENLRTELQKKSIEQNTARVNIKQAKERMQEEENDTKSLKADEAELAAEIAEVNNGIEASKKELKDSEELEKNVQSKILEFQKQLDQMREEETQTLANKNEWDVKVEKILQAQGFKQADVDRIDEEIENNKEELAEVLEALENSAKEIEESKKHISELEQTITASYDFQNQGQETMKKDLARKEELSSKVKNYFDDNNKMTEDISRLDKEVFRLEEQKNKCQNTIEAQINYMWDEYEITLSDAASLRNEEMNDLSAMKKEISSLKDKIRKLGDVNVNAIEDYKNIMERYTFLKNQHDDLVEAEKTLEGIIEELDTSMRKQFTEKFAEINREYDKVFKELFGGGSGKLELMEEEDILEAGVRIIAQPPGKKLQNMMQLSGGEKALSAIALLFAIQNLKPSPFCLLDEIEAALDDSNVGRFAKYLHKLTKNTQFIVITHRRGTMEQVDRLYGITMQEKGVSTLVSVNLIDKDLTN